MACPECGTTHLAYDDAGALVCMDCGTLPNPTQTILADHSDRPNRVTYFAPRNSKGWHLAQTKQDRDRRNTIAMGTFIASVLSKLNNPGLSSRAEAIFTQAMTEGRYRWGRRAKLTAGAAIAIALREAHKSDLLHDISFFLDDSPVSLSRTFRTVVSLLDLTLDSTDPAVHLPILYAHLQSVLHPETLSPSQLPKSLASVLTTLSLQVAVRTATSLSQIVLHHLPPLPLTHLPTPPTACALLILGLEAQARAPLPHLGELARSLASRFALSPGVVSSRYKSLYDLIEEWIRHVPWLDQFVHKAKGRRPAARSKVPKRHIVAKGIKDVIQFREEIWHSRMQDKGKVKLDLELDPSDVDNEGDDVNISARASSSKITEPSVTVPPRREMEKKGNVMEAAYQFLLDPLSSGSINAAMSGGDISLLSHILTCSPDELSRVRGTPPTRLQLLTASRGGSTEEDIADEELFVDGELEGLLRSEQERVALQPLFELNWGGDISKEKAAASGNKATATEMKRGAKRVNMDALARFLDGTADGDNSNQEDAAEFPDPGSDAYLQSSDYTIRSSRHQTEEDVEVICDRRHTTPDDDGDIFRELYNTADDRYEEEL